MAPPKQPKDALRYYGDPALRQQAQPIQAVGPEIHELAQVMQTVIQTHNGCGMAANQAGALVRLIVVRLDQIAPDGSVVEGEIRFFVNPKLSDPSKEKWEFDEGCMSIPGVRVPVERPWAITLEALDLDGNSVQMRLEGLSARIAMHENDILNGVLMIDRTDAKRRRQIEPILRRLKQAYP